MTSKAWRLANPERYRAHQLKSDRKNKATVNAKNQRYRARKRGVYDIVTELDKFVVKEIYNLAVLRSNTTGIKWDVDHIIPLNKGGRHAIDNLQVIPASINRSKKDKLNGETI